MSSQHRATPEHWAGQEKWASPPDLDPYATCLLELRARVEALEAASSHRRHGKAAEHAKPDPAASLVDRVANAAFAHGALHHDEARAAIQEVAAWLRSDYPKREGYGTAWANLLDNEANR